MSLSEWESRSHSQFTNIDWSLHVTLFIQASNKQIISKRQQYETTLVGIPCTCSAAIAMRILVFRALSVNTIHLRSTPITFWSRLAFKPQPFRKKACLCALSAIFNDKVHVYRSDSTRTVQNRAMYHVCAASLTLIAVPLRQQAINNVRSDDGKEDAMFTFH